MFNINLQKTKAKWGIMTPQHMIEHLEDYL